MAEQERCYAPKHGRIDLTCELDEGHDGWHRATYTDHQQVDYQGSHHDVMMTETVTWEPFDAQVKAALRKVTGS